VRSTNSLTVFGVRTNCLNSGRSPLSFQFTIRAMKLTIVITEGYHCYQLHTKCYQTSFSRGLSPLSFNLALEYAIRKVQENQVELKLNWLTSPGRLDLWKCGAVQIFWNNSNKNLKLMEIKRLSSANACYHSVQSHLSSCLLSKNIKIKL
jgi:hypothetical protein